MPTLLSAAITRLKMAPTRQTHVIIAVSHREISAHSKMSLPQHSAINMGAGLMLVASPLDPCCQGPHDKVRLQSGLTGRVKVVVGAGPRTPVDTSGVAARTHRQHRATSCEWVGALSGGICQGSGEYKVGSYCPAVWVTPMFQVSVITLLNNILEKDCSL